MPPLATELPLAYGNFIFLPQKKSHIEKAGKRIYTAPGTPNFKEW